MELIIDGSSQVLVGALINKNFRSHFTLNNNIKHSQKLMKFIKTFIEENSMKIKNLKKIGIGIGPGSFTGLRVSVAFIKGISATLGVKLIPIPSMDIYSYLSDEEKVIVIIPAREGFVYVAKYENHNVIDGYKILNYEEAKSNLKKAEEIIGYGAEKLGIKLKWYKKYLNGTALIKAYENSKEEIETKDLKLIYVQEPLAIRELRKINDRKSK